MYRKIFNYYKLTQNNIFLNTLSKEFFIYNEIIHKGFDNNLITRIDFKQNVIFTNIRQQFIILLFYICVSTF